MNLGLSDVLKKAFPYVVPIVIPLVENAKIKDPNWLAGFTSAEGCFMVLITPSKTHSVGFLVRLEFNISQHFRDEQLIRSLIKYFECGKIQKNGENFEFRVRKFGDITEKIIPFFSKHRIRGVKALDFANWCKAAELMKDKKHLTAEGLEEIRKIKAGMNRGRKLSVDQ